MLICGSLAYDHVMAFEGRFRDHILPEHIHMLNLCFLAPRLRRSFGGCAGNVAYALRALGAHPLIMAVLGNIDADPYLDRLSALGLSTQYVQRVPHTHCAQATILTDSENNQLTVFHPGAMSHARINRVNDVLSPVRIGLVAPNDILAMKQDAQQFAERNIPFIFDPGQQLPLFSQAELRHILTLSTWLTVNDYEARLLSNQTGWSIQQIAERVNALLVTRGAQGVLVYHHGQCEDIPAIPVPSPVDPTGCGDAFRGGLLYGIDRGFDWLTICQLANLMGAMKIAHPGPQGYFELAVDDKPDVPATQAHTQEIIASKFKEIFGRSLQ